MKKRFAGEQVRGFLKEAETGVAVTELCRQHGFSEETFHEWRRLAVISPESDATLEALEAENAQLWRALAESIRGVRRR